MNQDNEILIEKFLAGLLSEEEHKALEKRLATDHALQQELDLQSDMISVLRTNETERIKEDLATLWEDSPKDKPHSLPPKGVRKLSIWLRLAAVLLPFALISVLLFYTSRPNADSLVASYLAAPYPITVVKEATRETGNLQKQAIVAYQNGHYAKSSQIYAKLLESEPNNIEYRFFLGLSFLYQSPSKSTEASVELKKVISSNSSLYGQQAHWYLALVAFEGGDRDQAKTILKMIVDEGGWNKEEAGALLEKLD